MSRHRATRPRYGRITAAAGAAAVTVVSVLGGMGLVGTASGTASSATDGRVGGAAVDVGTSAPAAVGLAEDVARAVTSRVRRAATALERQRAADRPWEPVDRSLPDGSGEGRRVVFSESRQQVWLVTADDRVVRTYLVSGSIYDNLDPGRYDVYSRSEDAVGIDDSGTMRYFVRFTRGDNAAIGFHDIPVDDGERVQTLDQLGTPLSHGCIRQRRSDAIALWEFAPLGATVVVIA